jgi:NAD(P)-dependent dehydrogenase (short-subunit alcohol dehydrogenase family)
MSVLREKIALITGGTTGIGLATARLFHAEGARVFVTGQNADTLAAARAMLPADVEILRADARSISDAENVAARIQATTGGLDIAFLNAGVGRFTPFGAVDEAFYDLHMDVNVKGAVFMLKALLPLLRPGASVLVNSSVVGQKGVANFAIAAASKGALSALVRSLALELAERDIRINAISPGLTATPFLGKFGFPEEVRGAAIDKMVAKIPLKRAGDANEVAQAALFLSSAAASFVTGSDLRVDGGWAA